MPTRCLQAQKKPHRETRKDMTQRTSQKGEKQNHARAKSVEAANRGWMSEKYLPPADQVKCFFLTSPFIEPAPVRKSEFADAIQVSLARGQAGRHGRHSARTAGGDGVAPDPFGLGHRLG